MTDRFGDRGDRPAALHEPLVHVGLKGFIGVKNFAVDHEVRRVPGLLQDVLRHDIPDPGFVRKALP